MKLNKVNLKNMTKKLNFKLMFLTLGVMIMNLKYALADEIAIPNGYTIKTDNPFELPIVETPIIPESGIDTGKVVAACIIGVIIAIVFVAGTIYLIMKGKKANEENK